MELYENDKEFMLAQMREIRTSVNSLSNEDIIAWIEEHALEFRNNHYLESKNER